MHHSALDQASLALAREVAQRLRRHPELVELARDNLRRWSHRNASAPALLRCYSEWEAILRRPVPEVCRLLCAPTDEGQRLRQNSPFAGVLAPSEVWQIKSRFRHAAFPA